MEIKELVFHPAQLIDVELAKVVATKKEEYNPEEKELELEISVSSEVFSPQQGKSKINVIVKGNGFQIEVEEHGLFQFEEIGNKEIAQRFLEAQAVRILWSYVRESIYDLSIRMLKRAVLIPTLDVVNTIEKAEKDK